MFGKKNETKTFYDEEQRRIKEKIHELEVGSPEYKDAWELMRNSNNTSFLYGIMFF